MCKTNNVAHVIIVSAQVLLVLTLGLRTLDFRLGLDNILAEDSGLAQNLHDDLTFYPLNLHL